MSEEEVGVMRNAMTTRAPCGANNMIYDEEAQNSQWKD